MEPPKQRSTSGWMCFKIGICLILLSLLTIGLPSFYLYLESKSRCASYCCLKPDMEIYAHRNRFHLFLRDMVERFCEDMHRRGRCVAFCDDVLFWKGQRVSRQDQPNDGALRHVQDLVQFVTQNDVEVVCWLRNTSACLQEAVRRWDYAFRPGHLSTECLNHQDPLPSFQVEDLCKECHLTLAQCVDKTVRGIYRCCQGWAQPPEPPKPKMKNYFHIDSLLNFFIYDNDRLRRFESLPWNEREEWGVWLYCTATRIMPFLIIYSLLLIPLVAESFIKLLELKQQEIYLRERTVREYERLRERHRINSSGSIMLLLGK